MRISTTSALLTTVALSATLTACGSGSDSEAAAAGDGGRLSVVASTNVWGDVAAQVGGDLVDVTSIVADSSQDPHSYEVTPQDLLAISGATVVIANGGGYDEFMEVVLDGTEPTDGTIINAIDVSGLTAPEGEELNEHAWYDLPSVQRVATQVAEELGALDPDNADTYAANAGEFSRSLDALIAEEEAAHDANEGKTVGVTEPLPLYLSEAMGLTNVTPEEFSEAVEEGDDVSVAVLKEALDTYADGEVDVLLYNEQTAGPVTEQVREAAEAADVPIVSVTETLPEGEDYLSWMGATITAVAAATGA